MNYRILGRTGLKVSEIGLGCEGFQGKDDVFADAMFQLALSNGVNCMDLYSPNPIIHRAVARNLQGRREKFILQAHLCTVWKDGQYLCTRDPNEVCTAFEMLLQNLETDYIDIGMIHYVDSEQTWEQIAEGPVMRYALAQKNAGHIRYIGVSSHNPKAAICAAESGLVDVIMFSVNPCYDLLPSNEDCESLWSENSYKQPLLNIDPDRKHLYELCQSLGIGITAMKVFGGGDLLSEQLSPAGKALSVKQCIHYALTRPAVAAVMAGARSIGELQASLDYENAAEAERDYAAAFTEFPRMNWEGHCMYCGHCAPCPKEIDIATVTKFLNLTKAQGAVPETVREHYVALSHKAGECIECGACEKRCPFGVSIRNNMQQAKSVFGQ